MGSFMRNSVVSGRGIIRGIVRPPYVGVRGGAAIMIGVAAAAAGFPPLANSISKGLRTFGAVH